MKRAQLEHLIRAAGAISGSRRLLIVGSQSILGQHPFNAPARALLSREADMFPLDAPSQVDVISAAIGELSAFDASFGYYADGVSESTAILPDGWRDRLVVIDNENTNGFIGLCLDTHDLLISKYVAGRDKDHEFCQAVVRAGLVQHEVLSLRLQHTPVTESIRTRIHARLARDFNQGLETA